jgi:hypothetical protein
MGLSTDACGETNKRMESDAGRVGVAAEDGRFGRLASVLRIMDIRCHSAQSV